MTAASELKSAAVVQFEGLKSLESRKRKTRSHTESQNAVKVVKAVKTIEAVEQAEAKSGSTTATVTKPVTTTTSTVVCVSVPASGSASPLTAGKATSGSTAAFHSRAASIQATGLPVSVFSKNSPIFPTIQQNPVTLRPFMPERFSRARRVA